MSVTNFATVSDNQRQALGLTVKDRNPQPKPAPAVAPTPTVTAGPGKTLLVSLGESNAGKRWRRPANAAGATLLTHVGTAPPADTAQWAFSMQTVKRVTTLSFDADLPPGTCVWVTAFYYGTRGEAGAAATPVCCYLGGSGVSRSVNEPAAEAYPRAA